VPLLPTFYLPGKGGKLTAETDSTPLIRRLEAEFEPRSVIPQDPQLAFLNYLVEDYADEWLTKAMFHYRWRFADDIDLAGTILPLWTAVGLPAEQHAERKARIAERQIGRLHVVGSNDVTAPVIESSYRRFLALFDTLLQQQPFVFGERPASADFGLYAQLTQLAKFDPTPSAICIRDAPRVHAWTDLVDDLSGTPANPEGWIRLSGARARLGDLFSEIGRVYAPALLANLRALESGEKQMTTRIDGEPWTQPAFPYQGKCLQWIRQEFAGLSKAHRQGVRDVLAATGCEPLLEAKGR
jgi:glutathione S-transferase